MEDIDGDTWFRKPWAIYAKPTNTPKNELYKFPNYSLSDYILLIRALKEGTLKARLRAADTEESDTNVRKL